MTTHKTHNRQTSMPPVGFEPTISASFLHRLAKYIIAVALRFSLQQYKRRKSGHTPLTETASRLNTKCELVRVENRFNIEF